MPVSGDLYCTDPTAQKYTRFVSFSNTVLDVFVNGSHPKGTAEQDDGVGPLRILALDTVLARCFRHAGFGPSIIGQFSITANGNEFGLEWDEDTNLLYSTTRTSSNRAFRHDGFSSTVLATISLPFGGGIAAGGCTWMDDGVKDFVTTSFSTGHVYRHDGFSATIKGFFVVTGGPQASSCYWDPGDGTAGTLNVAVQGAGFGQSVLKFDGFSTTILNAADVTSPVPTLRGAGYTNALEINEQDLGVVVDQTSVWTEDDAPKLFVAMDLSGSVVFVMPAAALDLLVDLGFSSLAEFQATLELAVGAATFGFVLARADAIRALSAAADVVPGTDALAASERASGGDGGVD